MAGFEFNSFGNQQNKQQKKPASFVVTVELSSENNKDEVGFLIQKFFEEVPENMLLRLAKKLRKNPKVLINLLNNPLMGLYL